MVCFRVMQTICCALGWLDALCLGLAVTGLVACTEDVDSTDVRTSGVHASMDVMAPGNGESEVTVGLRVGGATSNTFLDLKGEDELVASAEGEERTMSQSGDYYEATLGTEAGGTEINVAFNRGPDDTDAPNSRVTLPEPFELAGLDTGQTVSRADDITLTWEPDPNSEDMRWVLEGDCLLRQTSSTPDTGTVTISASEFLSRDGEENATCNAEICFRRSRSGTVDPAFGEGGFFDAVQRRCVAFRSSPE